MPPTPFRDIVPRLRRLLARRADGDSDAALVARFAATRDEAAFAELVARHGPLVRGVCRRVLGPDAADDAFQATFLVLAQKAGSIKRPAAVGSWLYGVAYHLSKQSQRRQSRRERHERGVTVSHEDLRDPSSAAALADLLDVLDAELARLPDRLRAPLLLCYIDGRTQDEAAKQLGWSLGTFRRRLDRARELLRVRMERRGATLSAGLFATLLAADSVTATVPPALIQTTTATAMTFLAGGTIAPPVLTLAREGIQMLGFPKLTAATVLVALLGGLTLGAGALTRTGDEKNDNQTAKSDVQKPDAPPAPGGGVGARLRAARFNHGSAIANLLGNPDGRIVLTQGERSIRMWNSATQTEAGALDLPDDGPGFWTSSLTPDGKTVLTTRRNGTAQVWNLADRKMLRSFRLAAPPFDVNQLSHAAHAPDGSAIAVVTGDGSLRVCDVAAGKERDELRSHGDGVGAVTFTPDSKTLLIVCTAGLKLWDAANGREMEVRGFVKGVRHLAISADGKRLALAVRDQSAASTQGRGNTSWNMEIKIYDLLSNTFERTLRGAPQSDVSLTFSPDGRFLFAPESRPNPLLLQWDLATGRGIRQYPPHKGRVSVVAFTRDGQTMLTADDRIHRWDWRTGRELDAIEPIRTDAPTELAVSPDARTVVTVEAGAIVVRELANGREVRRFTPPDASDADMTISSMALAGDGSTLAAVTQPARANDDGSSPDAARSGTATIWVWEMTTERLRHRFVRPIGIVRLALSADGRTLIAVGQSPSIFRWDLTTGQELERIHEVGRNFFVSSGGPRQAGSVIGIMPDGESIYRLDLGGLYSVFPRPGGGGNRPDRLPCPPQSRCIAITADARHAAFGGADPSRGQDGEVMVSDLVSKTLIRHIRGLTSQPRVVALTPDGTRLAVAGSPETPPITVWDVATGRELKQFPGLRGQATGLEFTADGKRLVAASSDGTLLVWDVPD